jgi:hypothetical protein
VKTTLFLFVALLFGPGCSGSSDESGPAGSDTHSSADVSPAADQTSEEPDSTGTDDGGSADVLAGTDLPKAGDTSLPTGDGELGEECTQGGDCKSGLCWSSADMAGCTIPCNSHEECQSLGPLLCLPMKAGLNACGPQPPVGAQCASHQDCVFPTACILEFNWCDLPECTFAADCPEGQFCEPGMRRCQPVNCASTYECENPVEFCLDGQCGPPDCVRREDCEAGEICSYTQGICTTGTPCNEEGACNFYNQVCVDGLCEPNLCATPCANEAWLCNNKSGKCGPACDGQACPAGWFCDADVGVCYENVPPFAAARIDAGGQLQSAATLTAGGTASLDGSLSADPEGYALTYSWMLLSKPPSASQATGTIFCQQEKCSLAPLSPGLYLVGLWVKDAAGGTSIQGIAAIWAD